MSATPPIPPTGPTPPSGNTPEGYPEQMPPTQAQPPQGSGQPGPEEKGSPWLWPIVILIVIVAIGLALIVSNNRASNNPATVLSHTTTTVNSVGVSVQSPHTADEHRDGPRPDPDRDGSDEDRHDPGARHDDSS